MMRSWRNFGIRLERNAVLKIQNLLKPFFPTLPDVYFSDSWITNMKTTDKDRQRHEKGEEFAANI